MSDRSASISESDSTRWQAAPALEFDWAEWDGEYVLFHRPSGKTHFVNAATAQLLKAILTVPRTVDEAIAVLAPGAAPQELAELRERTTEQFQLLEANGLVSVS